MSPETHRKLGEIRANSTHATEAEASAQREASLATVRPADILSQNLREIRARSPHDTQEEAYAQMDAAMAASRAASRTEVMDLPRPRPPVEAPK